MQPRSRRAVIALDALGLAALAPGCFFFATPMSESLFLLLTAAALYLARTCRPILSGLCGAGAAFTRSLVLLPVPLALAQCTRARAAGRVLTALSALASLGYLIAFALRWQVW